MMEEWRDIEGYEGLYQVSNLGKVKSLDRVDCRGRKLKGKIIKQKLTKNGYCEVTLYKNGKSKAYLVHRLVGIAFISNPNNLPCINHKIDDFQHRSDNRIENLEWCTYEYNNNYGTRKEKASESMIGKNKGKPNINIISENHPKAKKIRCITTGEIFNTIRDASKKYNINESNISKCCNLNNKRKSAGKHPITGEKLVWEYV